MYLIFDTETTGLPQNYSAPLSDFDNWPRCVQLAWQLHDHTGKLVSSGDYIVQPDGFTIPYNSEKVHGISTEMAREQGISLSDVMDAFEKDLNRTTFVVGHNLEFDLNIMGSEYLRMERENPLPKNIAIDTKDESTEYCAIPGGRGRYKWPTLAELHHKLFEVGFEEAHNAAADVDATARAFLELVRLGVIKPQLPNDLELDTKTATEWINPDHYMPKVRELKSRGVTGEEEKESSTIDLPKESKGKIESAFTHLHCHSKFSVLQAAAGIDELINKAKNDGMPAVALTDLGNMYGTFSFVQKAHAAGIKPIIGCECYFVEDRHQKKFTRDNKDKRYQQLFLAKNRTGYENLSKLCSLGYVEGYYYKFPRIDRELVERYREGLIATTGGLSGEVPDMILNRGEEFAEEALQWWHELFGDDFYIELVRHGLEEEERVNSVLLKFAEKYNIKVIATNNVFYLEKEDAKAHDALLCIDNGELMSTPIGRGRDYRFGFPNDEFYFKTQDEIKALFADHPEAIANTQEIVDKVERIELQRDVILPNYALPEGFETEDDFLRHLTLEGAKNHYGELTQEVTERIDHELNIIKTMGFAGYFLIVQDFIKAAREMDVFVGPGRGSAAGSVVAFCTGITNIDPLKYDLLFERFLNPERVSMPDIDIDFDDEGRQRVIDYVVDKYGIDQVAHIITFGTMAARSAIRDVARVLDLPLSEADHIAKLIPETIGISLADSIKEVKELQQIKSREDRLEGQTLKMAETLEGSVRNVGTHAAGIIIAPDKLTNYIPISTAKDTDLYVTQFDGKVIEDAGMLKMDFLGLKTLSILKTAIHFVKENYGKEYDLDDIPLDDEKTFELYQKGGTVGTFQFESDGMRKYLKELKPTKIDDLIAMNALYRPGPMQFIPDYINRKHGREDVEYPHNDLKNLLEPTFGIMIYQEQIMQVAQKMGGYSLGEADVLRRIMGKKKADLLPPEEKKFVGQAVEKGYEKAVAKDVFDKMAMFAGYGFNKSHSAAYSVVAYHTMYFKANYTAEYMAAVLSHNMNDIKKVSSFIEECQRLGIPVDPPNINTAEGKFVAKDGRVQYGLAAIKGVGGNAIDELVKERKENGIFSSIFDFSSRIDTRACNRRTIESLVQAGAFDTLHENRAQLLASVEDVLNYASRKQEEERLNQGSLFTDASGGGNVIGEPKLRECPRWTNIQRLNKERDLIGFYLSGHPLDKYKEDIKLFASHTLSEDKIAEMQDRETIRVVGIITEAKQVTDKKGRPMAFVSMEDLEGASEVMVFSEVYDRHQGLLTSDTICLLEGTVSRRGGIIANTLERVENLREKFQQNLQLMIHLKTSAVTESDLTEMARLFKTHKGETPVRLRVHSTHAKGPMNMNVRKFVIEPNNELLNGLRNILGPECVKLKRVSA